MRLVTYLLAAVLLWALTLTGPSVADPNPPSPAAAQAGRDASPRALAVSPP